MNGAHALDSAELVLEALREPPTVGERDRRGDRLVALDRRQDARLAFLAEAADCSQPSFSSGRPEIIEGRHPELVVKRPQRVETDPGDLRKLEDAGRQAAAQRLEELGTSAPPELVDLTGE